MPICFTLIAALSLASAHVEGSSAGAAKLAEQSAYAWQATAVELAVAGHNYPAAREYVSGLAKSPLAGWEAGYYSALLGKSTASLDFREPNVGPVHYSPDGRFLAVRINKTYPIFEMRWELRTSAGSLVATIKDPFEVQFTPDSTKLVSWDSKVRLWSTATGKLIKTLDYDLSSTVRTVSNTAFLTRSYPQNAFTWIDFASSKPSVAYISSQFWDISPDGKYVPNFGNGDGFILVSTSTGQLAVHLSVPPRKSRGGYVDYSQAGFAFSPDSTKVAVALEDGSCLIWSVPSGKLLYDSGQQWSAVFLKFSPDGSRLITARDDRTVTVLDAVKGKKLATIYPPNFKANFRGQLESPTDISMSPDNKRVLAMNTDGIPTVWDLPVAPNKAHTFVDQPTVTFHASNEQTDPNSTLLGHSQAVTTSAFSPDARTVATTSSDGTLRFWSANALDPVEQLRGHEWDVKQAVFSPDGKIAVTVSQDHMARVWNAETGRLLNVLAGHLFQVNAASFSHDGSKLCTCSQDGTAIVWSTKTWAEVATLRGHKYGVNSVAFSPDDKHVVTASLDGTAAVWNAASGVRESLLQGHKFAVNSASYSKDGKRIVTASVDGTSAIWNAATGQMIHRLAGHRFPVNSACFSDDGRWVVTASDDGTARIWNAATGVVAHVLNAHGLAVKSAAFSPSGWQVVTASADGVATVWTVATGDKFVTLKGHTDAITSVCFSPDGRRILTSSEDKTARVWDSVTGRQMAVLNGHLFGVNSAVFSNDGRKIITASKDCSARIWYSYARFAP